MIAVVGGHAGKALDALRTRALAARALHRALLVAPRPTLDGYLEILVAGIHAEQAEDALARAVCS